MFDRSASSRERIEIGFHEQCLAYKLHLADAASRVVPRHLVSVPQQLVLLHAYTTVEVRLTWQALDTTQPVVVPTGSPEGPPTGPLLHYWVQPVRHDVVDTREWLTQHYERSDHSAASTNDPSASGSSAATP